MFIRAENQTFLNSDAIVVVRRRGPEASAIEMTNGETHIVDKASFDVAEFLATLIPAAPGFVALHMDFDDPANPDGRIDRHSVIAWRVEFDGEITPIVSYGMAMYLLLENGEVRETGGATLYRSVEGWAEDMRKDHASDAKLLAARGP